MWGATGMLRSYAPNIYISIHAPRVGRDGVYEAVQRASSISIHAPRVGRDLYKHGTVAGVPTISIHAPRVGRDYRDG